MEEAIISLFVSLFIFVFGYGQLHAKVKSNRELSDGRYALVQKELDAIKDANDDTQKSLTEIKVTLQRLSSDIHYIKENIKID